MSPARGMQTQQPVPSLQYVLCFSGFASGPVVEQNGIWVSLGPWICLDAPRDRKFILYQGRPSCPRNPWR